MVIRTRIRAILFNLTLYCVSGAAVSFFAWHAVNGDRGLKARGEYERRIASLNTELADLRTQKANWRKRIGLMRPDSVDRDLLDEEARHLLARVGPNELVIYLDSADKR